MTQATEPLGRRRPTDPPHQLVGAFLSRHTEPAEQTITTTLYDLYAVWVGWCHQRRADYNNRKWFTGQLKAHGKYPLGVRTGEGAQAVIYAGLRLLPLVATEAEARQR